MVGLLKRLAFIADVIPPESIALSSGSRPITHGAMLDAVEQRMDWLLQSDSKVVALHAANSVEWVLFDLACQALAIVFIPLPAFFSSSQIQHCLTQSGFDTLLSDCPNVPYDLDNQFRAIPYYQGSGATSVFYAWKSISPFECLLPTGTQKITFTSGSTGNPKGVCLSMEHQWLVAQSLADAIGIQRPKHLCLLPLSTLLENIAGVYTPLLCGGEVVIPSDESRGFLGSSDINEKALLACINLAQPNSLILVPQLLMLLVHACASGWQPPASLTFIAVGGGKVAPKLIEQARQLGLPVYQGYGLSECGSVVALNTPVLEHVDSVGQVLPHCKVAIVENEIVVSGAVHLGYMDDSSSWYPEKIWTGDIGSLCDGYLSIEGRKKNTLITSFGRNISPEWIESVLMSKPLLRQCVVLGDAEPYLTTVICAPVQVDDETIQQWIDTCNESLPDYARVGGWLRVSEQQLQPYLTANNRPRRKAVWEHFFNELQCLYAHSMQVGQTVRGGSCASIGPVKSH